MKKTLYIFNHGELRRKDNSLYFESSEGKRRFIPIEDTSDLYIFGEVDVSKRFLEFVSQKQICIHYFNHYGYYTGTFYPREHYNAGHVIVKQVEHYLDQEKRLLLARTFIRGSVSQMIRILKYYQTRVKSGQSLLKDLQHQLTSETDQLQNARRVD